MSNTCQQGEHLIQQATIEDNNYSYCERHLEWEAGPTRLQQELYCSVLCKAGDFLLTYVRKDRGKEER